MLKKIILGFVIVASVYAQAAPSIEATTLELTQKSNTATEKAHALYQWIAENIAYDTETYRNGSRFVPFQDPAENAFQTRKALCEGYAKLFKRMCNYAGIKCTVINGWAKGYNYTPGETFPLLPTHSWNAVFIDGSWKLIDCTWAAGSLNTQGDFIKSYDEYWFFTPYNQFIFTHLPEQPSWQLLTRPVMKKEFETYPKLTADFFRYGLNPNDNKYGTFTAGKEALFTFQVPDATVLTSQLSFWDSPDINQPYTFERRTTSDTVEVLASFPSAGEYALKIFAKEAFVSGDYSSVVTYKIDVQQGNNYQQFATTYGPYTDKKIILDPQTPISAELKMGYQYFFKLIAPNATAVAIINDVDNSWQFLKKTGDAFEGYAEIKKGQVKLSAQFPEKNQAYSTLLEYTGK